MIVSYFDRMKASQTKTVTNLGSLRSGPVGNKVGIVRVDGQILLVNITGEMSAILPFSNIKPNNNKRHAQLELQNMLEM